MAAEKQFFLGGQAVLEGVMMRSPCHYAVAVRRRSGEITTQSAGVTSIFKKYRWLNIPFLRGMFALVEMMSLGIKTLRYSTDVALQDEEAERAEKEGVTAKPLNVDKTTAWIIAGSIVFALLFKYTVFFAAPNALVELLTRYAFKSAVAPWAKHALEGLVRIGFFVVFLAALSLMKDLRRIFEYHGAEHKVVNLVEAYDELTVANARRHSRIHRRCGTTFLFLVLVVGIFVFAAFGWGSLGYNLAIRLVTLPLVAGIAFEIVRLVRYPWAAPLATVLLTPGLVFQYLTTREPDDSQLEVALEAMKQVLNLERETVAEFVPAPLLAVAVPAAAATFH